MEVTRSEEVRHGGSMMTDHADRTVVDLEEGILIECGKFENRDEKANEESPRSRERNILQGVLKCSRRV
jgi:hypothetical protein